MNANGTFKMELSNLFCLKILDFFAFCFHMIGALFFILIDCWVNAHYIGPILVSHHSFLQWHFVQKPFRV
jgi:hypothetical protein